MKKQYRVINIGYLVYVSANRLREVYFIQIITVSKARYANNSMEKRNFLNIFITVYFFLNRLIFESVFMSLSILFSLVF